MFIYQVVGNLFSCSNVKSQNSGGLIYCLGVPYIAVSAIVLERGAVQRYNWVIAGGGRGSVGQAELSSRFME